MKKTEKRRTDAGFDFAGIVTPGLTRADPVIRDSRSQHTNCPREYWMPRLEHVSGRRRREQGGRGHDEKVLTLSVCVRLRELLIGVCGDSRREIPPSANAAHGRLRCNARWSDGRRFHAIVFIEPSHYGKTGDHHRTGCFCCKGLRLRKVMPMASCCWSDQSRLQHQRGSPVDQCDRKWIATSWYMATTVMWFFAMVGREDTIAADSESPVAG